jgi:hypothetical protein
VLFIVEVGAEVADVVDIDEEAAPPLLQAATATQSTSARHGTRRTDPPIGQGTRALRAAGVVLMRLVYARARDHAVPSGAMPPGVHVPDACAR